jgi:hypothetical protein
MARIKTYTLDPLISDKDKVIGTDADNQDQTKNFKLKYLRDYMLSGLEPEVGGNLKITTIVDNDSEETTPEDYFNNSVTPITVLHYEIVFLILNGRTFIFRKNNDVYGVDETQTTASDFTEIDITSVINANLQDLDSVLEEGDEAPLKGAYIKEIGFWDSFASPFGFAKIYADKSRMWFKSKLGDDIFNIAETGWAFIKSPFTYSFIFETLTSNRNATWQNKSGTVAYLSDIPVISVSDIVGGDNITVTEGTPGVFTIDGVSQTSLYCTETYLRDSVANSTYFNKGGYFTYNETTAPIDSIRLVFNQNISFVDETIGVGYIHVHYLAEEDQLFVYDFDSSSITGNYIDIPFDFEANLSGLLINGVSFIDITMYPNTIKGSNDVLFNGALPTSISRYVVTKSL